MLLSADLESDLYVLSVRCGTNDKEKVDILVDRVPVKFLTAILEPQCSDCN